VKYTDFFTPDGRAKIDDYSLNTRDVNKVGVENKFNFDIPQNADKLYKHIPIPQIKDSVLEFNKKYADFIDWIRMTKKRKDRGYDICEENNLHAPCQQIHYPIAKFMYSQHKAKLVNNENKSVYYIPTIDNNFSKKLYNIFKIKPKFFCINDVEKNPIKRKIVTEEMVDFFNEYYPDKPDFEK
jgi:hypothetical protein